MSHDMNDRNWTLLIDAIQERKVVLIIGDNLFHLKNQAETKINDYVLSRLNEKFSQGQDKASTFTEVNENIIDYNYQNRRSGNITNIYYEINQILKSVDYECVPSLKELSRSGFFPLILSTSFFPNIPDILEVQQPCVYVYKKSARSDINLSLLNPENPSLYFLFGKSSTLAKSYMVTEDDLLDYMHCWHDSDTRPSNISEFLAGKYLLVLGCDYPNWLFRFFWHSIKNFDISSIEEQAGIVSIEASNDDKDLRTFLSRIQANVCYNASGFMEELSVRLKGLHKETYTHSESVLQANDVDFFISYASEDIEGAEFIAQTFIDCGSDKVWFDKERLKAGNDYERIIKASIMKAKRFIPVLSKNTLKPGSRFFRKEWCIAEEARQNNYPREYIVPIILDDCDVYSDGFPETFSKAHCIHVSALDFKLKIKELIRAIRR